MALFTSKKKAKQSGAIVAVEALSVEIAEVYIAALEQELLLAGHTVVRLEFPSSTVASNIPVLHEVPHLLESPQVLGIAAAFDRAKYLADASQKLEQGEVLLLQGSNFATAAWLATGIAEYADRVSLYKWLDELDHVVFKQKRLDLTVFLDYLPEDLHLAGALIPPHGWTRKPLPTMQELRDKYLEAAHLLPGVKIVNSHRQGLLKPDSEIQNELWNLVRRIALKSNLPPKI